MLQAFGVNRTMLWQFVFSDDLVISVGCISGLEIV